MCREQLILVSSERILRKRISLFLILTPPLTIIVFKLLDRMFEFGSSEILVVVVAALCISIIFINYFSKVYLIDPKSIKIMHEGIVFSEGKTERLIRWSEVTVVEYPVPGTNSMQLSTGAEAVSVPIDLYDPKQAIEIIAKRLPDGVKFFDGRALNKITPSLEGKMFTDAYTNFGKKCTST